MASQKSFDPSSILLALAPAALFVGVGMIFQRRTQQLQRVVRHSKRVQQILTTKLRLAEKRVQEVAKAHRIEAERKSTLAAVVMAQRNALMHDPASTARGSFPNFVPRSGDVFTVTYPKCGTTWMTHMLHGLRSGGDLNFDEIQEVCLCAYVCLVCAWCLCVSMCVWRALCVLCVCVVRVRVRVRECVCVRNRAHALSR